MKKTAGFTALEVMFALAVLSVAILALVGSLSGSSLLRQQNRELDVARRELTRRMETFRGMTPAAIVTALGGAAALTGLEVTTDLGKVDEDSHASAAAGTNQSKQVLANPRLTIAALSEVEAQAAFGLADPPDLDQSGDGTSDPTRYSIVPVRFRIEWDTPGSTRASRELVTMFYPQTTVGS